MIVERTLRRIPYWLKLQRGCFCVQWLTAMSCSTLERDEVQVEDATNQNRQKVVDVSALQVSLLQAARRHNIRCAIVDKVSSRMVLESCTVDSSYVTYVTPSTVPYVTPSTQLIEVKPKELKVINGHLEDLLFVAHCHPIAFEALCVINELDVANATIPEQCKNAVVRFGSDGACYYPHVYTRDGAKKFLDGAQLMNYSSFSENERLQAGVMATYLAMQGIKASACDVQKAMRKEQQVAALVGSGADFGRMMLDSESRLWDALDLERVVFTDERVGWNRRHGNFHYQEMKLGQSYVLEIKEDSSPWSYSSRSLVGCGLLGTAFANKGEDEASQALARAILKHCGLASHL